MVNTTALKIGSFLVNITPKHMEGGLSAPYGGINGVICGGPEEWERAAKYVLVSGTATVEADGTSSLHANVQDVSGLMFPSGSLSATGITHLFQLAGYRQSWAKIYPYDPGLMSADIDNGRRRITSKEWPARPNASTGVSGASKTSRS